MKTNEDNLVITEETYKTVQNFYKQARSLADRWVKAGRGNQYYAGQLNCEYDLKRLKFTECCVDGCCLYPSYECVDFKYFQDDSTLEQDAKEHYKKLQKAKDKKSKEISSLRESEDVKKFLALGGANNYASNYASFPFIGINDSSL